LQHGFGKNTIAFLATMNKFFIILLSIKQ